MATPFLVAATLLSVILVAYTIASSLVDPLADSSQIRIAFYQAILKLLSALDVILPSALFFSVILGLGRLHRDAEVIALKAAGFSDLQLVRGVLYFAIVVALISSLAANVARPWAFGVGYAVRARAEAGVQAVQGRFVQLNRGSQVLFVNAIDERNDRLMDVYMHSNAGPTMSRVVVAETLAFPKSGTTDSVAMVFGEGSLYLLDRHGPLDRTLEFETLALPMTGENYALGDRPKAMETRRLAHSNVPAAIAELQWRLATPLTTLLLALLGIPLSHTSALPTTKTRIGTAIVIFTLLFGLFGVAHNLVVQGVVGVVPGIWWFYVPVVALLFILPLRRNEA